MSGKIYTQENLIRVEKLFGPAIGRTPGMSNELTGEVGTFFWADETIWSANKLRNMTYPHFKVWGPYLREDAPFNYIPPCDGFAIFVPDKD